MQYLAPKADMEMPSHGFCLVLAQFKPASIPVIYRNIDSKLQLRTMCNEWGFLALTSN